MHKTDSLSHGSQSERSMNPEIDRKWVTLVYKVYERMIHASEVSFFLSTPQLISTLGFLMGACGSEGIKDLISGYEDEKKEKTGGIEVDSLISDTIKLVHNWSLELRFLFGPGQYRQGRRVYAYPKFMHPHKENSFQMFRKFKVEEKVFEGGQEVREWLQRTLKVELADQQNCLNLWRSAPENAPIDRKRNRKKENTGVVEKISSKLPFAGSKAAKKKLEFSSWRKSGKNPTEQEKKPPILSWMSHAIVEMPADFFDGSRIFKWRRTRQMFLRIHESARTRIRMAKDVYDFNSLFLPTRHPKLTLIIFYNFDKELCPLDEMRDFVAVHRAAAPCIVKRKADADASKHKREVYFPYWKSKDFAASRIAQHLVASVNLESLFVAGGFGDLAVPDALPSSSGDPKKISHIQHFGLLSFKNHPESHVWVEVTPARNNRPAVRKLVETQKYRIEKPDNPEIEVIQYPICLLLWDGDRELPAYMGKITGELPDYELERIDQSKASKQKKKKKKNFFR